MNKVTYANLTAEQRDNFQESLKLFKFKLDFGIEAEDEQQAREKLEARIYAKLQSGKPLSPKEMQYLRKYNPELYMHAVRIEQKRKALENRLENADSKEEVQDICNSAMASVREDDPVKQYMMAAISETVKEFKESDQYKKLPETRKQAEEKEGRGKSRKGSIIYETGEYSYQMAYVEEAENDEDFTCRI